jgi:hypothetical protein
LGIKLEVIQLKHKNIKIIRTIIKIMEYDVKISHVMIIAFSAVCIIVLSHVVECLSRWYAYHDV